MARIDVQLNVKDNMSPILKTVAKTLTSIIQKNDRICGSLNNITKGFQSTASVVNQLPGKVNLTAKQLTQINDLNNRIINLESSKLKLAEAATSQLRLSAKEEQKILGLLNERSRLVRLIGQHESANADRQQKIYNLNKQIESLKRATVVDENAIKAKQQEVLNLERQIESANKTIDKHKHALLQKENRIAQIGSAEVSSVQLKNQLLLQYSAIDGKILSTEQGIATIMNQALNTEQKQLDTENKIAAKEAEKNARIRDGKLAIDQVNHTLDQITAEVTKQVGLENKLTTEERLRKAYNEQLATVMLKQGELTNKLTAAQTTLNTLERQGNIETQKGQEARQKVLSLGNQIKGLKQQELQIEKNLKNVATEAAAIDQKELNAERAKITNSLRLYNIEYNRVKASLSAYNEKIARERDFLSATLMSASAIQKSFIEQRKLSNEIARGSSAQQTAINLNRQLKDEKARLKQLESELVTTQTKINNLERTGKSLSAEVNAAKARKVSLLHQIGNQQQKILGVQRQIKTATNQNAEAQNRHNGYLRGAVNDANRLLNTLRNVVSVYAAMNAVKGTLNLADSMASGKARIANVIEGYNETQSVEEVSNKIYESAMRSRACYEDVVQLVGRMGIGAAEAFKGTDEVIKFTETLSKMAVVSGTKAHELSAVMLQISQAMGSGVLQGDEYRSATENMSHLRTVLADYLNVSTKKLKELSKKGVITSDVLKNAVLRAADDIDKRMKNMPVTWGQVWNMCKNYMIKASNSILEKISAITSSKRFVGFMQNLAYVFQKLKDVASDLFNKMCDGIAYVYDNWGKLKSSIIPVVAALVAYKIAMTAASAISAVYAFWQSVVAARHMMAAGKTLAQAASQHSLNAAMLACPLTWFIALLVIVLAVLGSIELANYDWANSTVDVWGTIKNVFMALANFLKNVIIKAWYMLKDVALQVWGVLKSIALFVIQYWSFIAPIIWGIVGAFVAYKTALMIVSIWTGIVAVATKVMAFFKGVAAAATALATGATYAETAAQWGLNAAMYACPLTWIVLAIIALIVILYLAVAAVNHFAGTSVSATGIIFAAFAMLAANIWNTIVAVWNGILRAADFTFNIIVGIVEWFLNVCGGGFDSFGDAVANLLGNIISWFLDLGAVVTEIIDAIFGTNWTAGLESLKAKVLSWGKNKTAVTLKRDLASSKLSLNRVDSIGWSKSAYKFGENLSNINFKNLGSDIAKGIDLNGLIAQKDPSASGAYNNDMAKALTGGYDGKNPALDKIGKDTGTIAKNTGAGSGGSGGVSGDVDHLRELAEREAINKYTLTDLNVNMTNNNNIGSGTDATEVGRRLWRALVNGALNQAQRAIPF